MLRLFAAIAILVAAALPARAMDAAAGPVVLTVAGAIENANRGALDPFSDAFLNYQKRSFDRAAEFDRDMLAALPQVEVKAFHPRWPGVVTAKGPLIADVLKAVGASEGATVQVMALDGYVVELSAGDIAAHRWIIALDADGRPLGVGQRGPLWSMYDTGGAPATDEEEARWVWSVLYMEVR